jgi:hypothetical protein
MKTRDFLFREILAFARLVQLSLAVMYDNQQGIKVRRIIFTLPYLTHGNRVPFLPADPLCDPTIGTVALNSWRTRV